MLSYVSSIIGRWSAKCFVSMSLSRTASGNIRVREEPMEIILKLLSKVMWKGKHFSKSACVMGHVLSSTGKVLALREASRENDIPGSTGEGRSPLLSAIPALIRLSFRLFSWSGVLSFRLSSWWSGVLGSILMNGHCAAVGEGRLVLGGRGETAFESNRSPDRPTGQEGAIDIAMII